MRLFTTLSILLLFICCRQNKSGAVLNQSPAKPVETSPAKAIPGSYDSFLKLHKQKLQGLNAENNLSNKKAYFFSLMNDSIPNYWTGTKWDFNGTTYQPGQGAIACGYFITTVMQQLGFAVERNKLAQQASSKIIDKFCVGKHNVPSASALKDWLNAQPDSSVFIVGLDFHTGFVLKETTGKYYFLHSNYIGRQGVVKEPIETSRALNASKWLQIGSISANKLLMNNWGR